MFVCLNPNRLSGFLRIGKRLVDRWEARRERKGSRSWAERKPLVASLLSAHGEQLDFCREMPVDLNGRG